MCKSNRSTNPLVSGFPLLKGLRSHGINKQAVFQGIKYTSSSIVDKDFTQARFFRLASLRDYH